MEEITQLDMALWADLACVGLNADVKFLLLGDFRQLPAVLDSWAGRPISAPLEHSQLIRDLAGGHRHERPAGLGGEQLPGPRLGLLQSRPTRSQRACFP